MASVIFYTMPPKKIHCGIMACDPSFKASGWAFYSDGLSWQATNCYDMRKGLRVYDTADKIRDLTHGHLTRMLEDFPLARELDVLVIEGQFKRKMQRLQESICNQMRALIGPELKIIVVPAYAWRKYFDITMDTYTQNKQASVVYLRDNPQLLCWKDGINNDNIAEAILLLNYAVQKHGLSLAMSQQRSNAKNNQGPPCQACGSDSVLAISTSEKNPNRVYHKCQNQSCEKKGFMCWQGEESKYGTWNGKVGKAVVSLDHAVDAIAAGTKRKLSNATQPAAKKVAPTTKDLTYLENMISVGFRTMLEKFVDATNRLDAIEEALRPRAIPSLLCQESPLTEQYEIDESGDEYIQ